MSTSSAGTAAGGAGSDSPYVIVGASLAGAKAAEELRAAGHAGRIVLIGDESELPYERPPLSKGYLLGKDPRDKAYVQEKPSWYDEHGIELRLGHTVTSIDPAAHTVTLDGRETLGYAKLLLTTGSTPRRLPVPGADLDGVRYLRRLEDSDRLLADFRAGSRVVVIGAGWIGLETAAAAREHGCAVSVVEMDSLPLRAVLGDDVAALFRDLHIRHGVTFHLGTEVAEITGEGGKVTGVRLTGGDVLDADVVVVGIGITPNSAIAEAAGLEVDNGIRTDDTLRTSDPDIYAAGDVANASHPVLGRSIRVEHWANALNQPRTAARAMLGEDVSYDRMPYFFTDQYELGMEYTGYAAPGAYDRVLFRGDPSGGEYIAFWIGEGRVLAGMNVNVWDVTDAIKELVRSGRTVDPERLADPSVPLDSL
ncbi:FAD/NAD(P)-binding oxidoreductase [Streptomyces sp. NPDC000410]|uniref:NAD(P)/FAD-dependent oxidoreductase n=1 Tax=Streptomyces sp. NPDC000410 TaxID=3154254 RepID=UPI003332BE4F